MIEPLDQVVGLLEVVNVSASSGRGRTCGPIAAGAEASLSRPPSRHRSQILYYANAQQWMGLRWLPR